MRGTRVKAMRNEIMSHKDFIKCKQHPRYAVDPGHRMHPGPWLVRSDFITAWRQAKNMRRVSRYGS